MTNLTPDSPVEALWPAGEGGLNGRRALARLKAAGKTTVREVLPLHEADILDIPRAGQSVAREVRRALHAAGLHLASERAPSLQVMLDARDAGKAEAARTVRRRRQPDETVPASREEFAALVKDLRAELDQAGEPGPERYAELLAGRPWAWQTAGPKTVSEMTGYSAVSIRRYQSDAREAASRGVTSKRLMPLPNADGRWVIGELAMWMATRNEAQAANLIVDDATAALILADVRAGKQATGKQLGYGQRKRIAARYGVSPVLVGKLAAGEVPARERKGALKARQEPRRVRADDDQVATFLAARIAAQRRYVPAAELLTEARAAGLAASPSQLARLLPAIRAAEARRRGRPAGQARAKGESLHPEGWLSTAEVAEDWGVTPNAVIQAYHRGELARAGRGGGKNWYDPARLRNRKDKRRTPVDVAHPMARVEPGDPGYEGGTGR